MKIVFLDAKTMGAAPGMEKFNQLGDYIEYAVTSPEERLERMRGAVVVITCKVIIDQEMIEACPELKLICVAATGTNNVDVSYAVSKGIEVRNVTGYSTESVAQHTLSVLLNLNTRIGYYDAFVKNGSYSRSDMFTHYGPAFRELKGKTAGIIGLGNIGSRVAELYSALGMNIIYHSVSGNLRVAKYPHADLKELLSTAEVISIHCPLTEKSNRLINQDTLKLLKPEALVINMARGGIVDEKDMVDALNNHLLAGYGTDVYEKEPLPAESLYLKVKYPEKLILTPHMAWTSLEARVLLIQGVIQNIAGFKAENNE